MRVELGLCLKSDEPLTELSRSSWMLNTLPAHGFKGQTHQAYVVSALASAQVRAKSQGQNLTASLDLWRLHRSFRSAVEAGDIEYSSIDDILSVIACYRRQVIRIMRLKVEPSNKADLIRYDPDVHHALVRYGNVELRVLQNYFLDPEGQRIALDGILGGIDNDDFMYAEKAAAGYLGGHDFSWNLRRLMTNAGFYVMRSPGQAHRVLVEWAERYAEALKNNCLVWHNNFYPYYLKIELTLWLKFGVLPNYVRVPSVFGIYDAMRGREVVFMSPMAHLAREQLDSGRLQKLYLDYEVPPFSLRALGAWISTWPNRPHGDWSETFGRLCESVEATYAASPFELFIASCGCYGLPICNYVRERFGCRILYIGNFSHVLFGIRQATTREFMIGRINAGMWLDGDLGRYPNVDRIDGGRYL